MPKAAQFFMLNALLCLSVLLMDAAQASESWVQSQVSPSIFKLNKPISQKIDPPKQWQHRNDAIRRVDLQLTYHSNATVTSQLCLASSYQCVNIVGSTLSTDAFNDAAINSSFFLVHTVNRWNGADPNLFIKSSLIVWSGH